LHGQGLVCLQRINGSTSGPVKTIMLWKSSWAVLKPILTYTDIDEVIRKGMHEYLDGPADPAQPCGRGHRNDLLQHQADHPKQAVNEQ
jgi:hypothetical protein